jgi:hypothetical protein
MATTSTSLWMVSPGFWGQRSQATYGGPTARWPSFGSTFSSRVSFTYRSMIDVSLQDGDVQLIAAHVERADGIVIEFTDGHSSS